MPDPSSLFLDLVIGLVGLALFVYGRKASRGPQLVAGLLLMVYPYFVSSALQMFWIGAAIIAGLAGALWLGW
ncbi:MAG TPA: hypothetical protein VG736_01560 [Vicinamibacterales bacterium]|nr:hypothetical protein [Vicinamibacterales bacterium]